MNATEALKAMLDGHKVKSVDDDNDFLSYELFEGYIYARVAQDIKETLQTDISTWLRDKEAQGYEFEIYDPKPKMIKWYAPHIVWVDAYAMPQFYEGDDFFYRNKHDFYLKHDESIKVLEWKEIEAPETSEECEGLR